MKPLNALMTLTGIICLATALFALDNDNPFALACIISSAMFWGYYYALFKNPLKKVA